MSAAEAISQTLESWPCALSDPPGEVLVEEVLAVSSFSDRPASLFARHLGMRAVVFLGVLDGRYAMYCGRTLELDVLAARAVCAHGRMFLEDALGRT